MTEVGQLALAPAQLRDWIDARRGEGIELFLQVGKLRFRGAKEKLTDEVMATLRTNRDAIHEVLAQEFERDNRYDLSYSQQAVYMLYRLVPNNPAYNTVFAAQLHDDIDVAALSAAYDAVAARHAMFNTRFSDGESSPCQWVLAQQPQGLRVVDASDWTQRSIDAWIDTESDAPFDLAQESAFRATLLQAGHAPQTKRYLVLTVHHIGADLWSLLLIAEQLQTAYRQVRAGETITLPASAASYRDHVGYQQQYVRSARGDADWHFWQQRLSDMPALLPLPTDVAREDVQHMRGARVSLPLSPNVSTQLREFCRLQGVTPFMLVQAALQLLLFRLTGQLKFVIGTPTAGRVMPGSETVVGDFANPVALCADFTTVNSGAALLAQVRRQVLDALEHQAFPFPELVARLMPPRDLRRSPLFQVMYVWHQAQPQSTLAMEHSLIAQVLPQSGPRGAPYDVMLAVSDEPSRLVFNWSYDRALYRHDSVANMAAQLVELLLQLINDTAKKIANFTLPPLPVSEATGVSAATSKRYTLNDVLTRTPLELLQLDGIRFIDANNHPAHAGQWSSLRVPVSDGEGATDVTDGWYQPRLTLQAPLSHSVMDQADADQDTDDQRASHAPWQICYDAGYGWLGKRITSLRPLERDVLALPGVRQALARCRARAQDHSVIQLFVVLDKPASLAVVNEYLQQAYPNEIIMPVVLPHVPRTAAGDIDDAQLDAMPVWMPAQQTQLMAQTGTPALLTLLPQYVASEPLYLPDFGINETVAGAADEFADGISLTDDVPLAYADGGELNVAHQSHRTLTAAFLYNAQHSSAALIFVNEYGDETRIDYPTLLNEARILAAGLQAAGLARGDYVLLQLARPREFFPMFWGCVLSGVIPVSVAVPEIYTDENAVARKVANVYQSIEGCTVIADDAQRTVLEDFLRANFPHTNAGHTNTGHTRRCLFAGDLRTAGATREADIVMPEENDVLFLQLTSGSTGTPKAIQETHRGIVAHIHGAAQYNGYDVADVSLNWLPTDHVVPILTTHLKDCYLGITQIQLATRWVLQQPLRWIDAVDRYRVTHTWAPNFAFRLVNLALQEALQRGQMPAWDLHSVKQFMNAGEQVTAAVICEFAQRLQPFGLNAAVIQPAFGMAECCTCITYRRDFDGEQATILTRQQQPRAFVDLGAPVPGVAIRIVDADNQLVPEGVIGRFQMKGAVVTPGYLNNPRANAESLLDDGWFNSGDLGFIRDGHLALTGREKETIILYGNNLYCYEIEEQVSALEDVRPTFVAAVGVRNESIASDELVLFYVPNDTFMQRVDLLQHASRLAADIARQQGIRSRCVVPLQSHEFPKTTSGKIQRLQLKKEWLDGTFREYLRAWDMHQRNDQTLPAWFYRPTWLAAALPKNDLAAAPVHVLYNDSPLARDLLGALRAVVPVVNAMSVSTLLAGQPFFSDANAHGTATDVFTVVLDCKSGDGSDDNSDHVASTWIAALKHIATTAERQRLLWLVCEPSQTDLIATPPAAAALLQSVAGEYPQLRASVLLCSGDVCKGDVASVLPLLRAEISKRSHDTVVRYCQSQSKREVFSITPAALALEQSNSNLSADDICLVTGAGGGIARHLIPHLLATTAARLILLSHSSLSDDSLQLYEATARRASVQNSLHHSRIVNVCADLADVAAVSTALDQARAKFGVDANAAISAVFHLAGHARFDSLVDVDVANVEAQLAAKTRGTQVLINLLGTQQPAQAPLFVAFSSVNGLFGGNQASVYSLACARQAEIVIRATARGAVRGYTLAWSQWSGIGMSALQGEAQKTLAMRQGFLPVSPQQGMASLDIALRQPPGLLVIGLRDDCHVTQARCQQALPRYVPAVIADRASASGLGQHAQRLLLSAASEYERCALLQRRITVTAIDYALTSSQLSDISVMARLTAEVNCGDIRADVSGEDAAPTTPSERRIHAIWRDVLGRECSVRASFFEAGGDSLAAMQVASRLQSAFAMPITVADLFTHVSIAQIAAWLDGRSESTQAPAENALPVMRHEHQTATPLSASQSRVWFLQQFTGNAALWNVVLPLRVRGNIEVAALQRAVNAVIDRHEVFSTRVVISAAGPLQQRVATSYPVVTEHNISGGAEALEHAAQLRASVAFDLSNDVLLRVDVFSAEKTDEKIVQIATHHIVSDGWSLGNLLREIFAALTQQTLAPLNLQYADFAISERLWLQALDDPKAELHKSVSEQAQFWHSQLAGAPAQLAFYTDAPRPVIQSWQGDESFFTLDDTTSTALSAFCRQQGATPFMVLMSVYALLLSRYCRERDIVVGTPVANRATRELEDVIGLFMNTLAIRTHIDETQSFTALLQQVRDTTLQAWQHQQLPFEKIVELLAPPRNLGHSPLFQHMLIVQNTPLSPLNLPGLVIEPITRPSTVAKFDLTMQWYLHDARWCCSIEYSTALLGRSAVSDFFDNFALLLSRVLAQPELALQKTVGVHAAQLARMQQVLSPPSQSYPRDLSLFAVLAQQAMTRGEMPAVRAGHITLDYSMLYQRVCQLGGLLQSYGVTSGNRVGVALQRNENLPAVLLAIMAVGATYVPLDPDYPQARVAYMLDHSAPALLVTDSPSLEKNAALNDASCIVCNLDQHIFGRQGKQRLETLCVEQPLMALDENHLAYVIYTSGSTGQPKGVQVYSHGLANFLTSMQQLLKFDAQQTLLAVTSLSFDIAALELYLPLLAGGTVVIATRDEAQDGRRLRALVRDCAVTSLQATPVTWHLLLDSGWRNESNNQFMALCGGEPMPASLARQLIAAGATLFNVYGPTETTIWSTLECVTQTDGSSIAIGAPIANTQLFILDEYRNPVPQGVAGELYIGGDGVAAGYLGRDDLTQQAFISTGKGGETAQGVIYKTGDLVRLGFDGALHCLGRIDNQIKLRGFRIELGDIEATLESSTLAEKSVVIADRTTQALIAVVVPAHAAASAGTPMNDAQIVAALLQHARQQLPGYMVPNRIVLRDDLPLTPNGKIDRKAVAALPELASAMSVTAETAHTVAPQSPLQQTVLTLWQTVIPIAGVTDNFFDNGGHSLMAARLAQVIENHFAIRFPTFAIFNAPTVAECAAQIEQVLQQLETAPLSFEATEGLCVLQRGDAQTWVLFYPVDGALHHYGDVVAALKGHTVYGIEQRDEDLTLDIAQRAQVYAQQLRDKLADAETINLLGWSLGGVIAQAVAVELQEVGLRVGQLVMLDSYLTAQLPERDRLNETLMLAAFAVDLGAAIEFAATLAGATGATEAVFTALQQHLSDRRRRTLGAGELAHAFERFRVNHAALQQHVPRHYGGAARLFTATANPLAAVAPPQLGWQPFVGQLSTTDIVTDHYGIVHRPEVVTDLVRKKINQNSHKEVLEET